MPHHHWARHVAAMAYSRLTSMPAAVCLQQALPCWSIFQGMLRTPGNGGASGAGFMRMLTVRRTCWEVQGLPQATQAAKSEPRGGVRSPDMPSAGPCMQLATLRVPAHDTGPGWQVATTGCRVGMLVGNMQGQAS